MLSWRARFRNSESKVNYQVEILAAAIAYAYGNGEVQDIEREEAADMVEFLSDKGWRITRKDTDEHVTEGPIQRALGMNETSEDY